MATREIAGKTVQVNEEGFLTNPSEWTKEIAVELAKEEGIEELTEAHWKVIAARVLPNLVVHPHCAE